MKIIIAISIFCSVVNCAIADCMANRVKLQVLGSGGPELNDHRASTSYLIWLDDKAVVMVDTGSGSSRSFENTGAKFNSLLAILFTHLHVDHSADFPAYIKHSYFSNRSRDLYVYGPSGNDLMPSTSSFVQSLFGSEGAYRYLNNYFDEFSKSAYKIKVIDVDLQRMRSSFHVNNEIKIISAPVHHGRIPAVAWRVEIAGCVITFSGDMSNNKKILHLLAENSDMLIAHNAVPENTNRIARLLHMMPSEIGEIANLAKVKKVILSHRMLRTTGTEQNTIFQINQKYNGVVEFADDLSIHSLD